MMLYTIGVLLFIIRNTATPETLQPLKRQQQQHESFVQSINQSINHYINHIYRSIIYLNDQKERRESKSILSSKQEKQQHATKE